MLKHVPSQRLPATPVAQPIDPAATKKDAGFYWHQPPTARLTNSVNRSIRRWLEPPPYDRAHLVTLSHSSAVAQLPEQVWSGFPQPEAGPGAVMIARRLRHEDAALELRRLRLLEHRASCHERLAKRQLDREDAMRSIQLQGAHKPRDR